MFIIAVVLPQPGKPVNRILADSNDIAIEHKLTAYKLQSINRQNLNDEIKNSPACHSEWNGVELRSANPCSNPGCFASLSMTTRVIFFRSFLVIAYDNRVFTNVITVCAFDFEIVNLAYIRHWSFGYAYDPD